eukprot:352670-Chlamydomonas_euryale.AAC.2
MCWGGVLASTQQPPPAEQLSLHCVAAAAPASPPSCSPAPPPRPPPASAADTSSSDADSDDDKLWERARARMEQERAGVAAPQRPPPQRRKPRLARSAPLVHALYGVSGAGAPGDSGERTSSNNGCDDRSCSSSSSSSSSCGGGGGRSVDAAPQRANAARCRDSPPAGAYCQQRRHTVAMPHSRWLQQRPWRRPGIASAEATPGAAEAEASREAGGIAGATAPDAALLVRLPGQAGDAAAPSAGVPLVPGLLAGPGAPGAVQIPACARSPQGPERSAAEPSRDGARQTPCLHSPATQPWRAPGDGPSPPAASCTADLARRTEGDRVGPVASGAAEPGGRTLAQEDPAPRSPPHCAASAHLAAC